MRSFGEIIKSRRQKLGLTQRQVADLANVSSAYVCSLESDKRSPPPYHTVADIADALQLDVGKLWNVAVKFREKQAMEKSRQNARKRRKIARTDDDPPQPDEVSESQIDAFFALPEIRMTTFGLFQKQPDDMTMEEKRVVYQAITSAREFIAGDIDESTGSP